MGEQPLFTTRAHVFQLDPATKKNWLPASKQAVSVSYFYDSTRNSYRIISVDGSKAIINSIITPKSQFTRTSQKFGQWADSRANTIYGLGFSTEAEINKFIDKFNELKIAANQGQEKGGQSTEQGSADSQQNGGIDKPAGITQSKLTEEAVLTVPSHGRQSSLNPPNASTTSTNTVLSTDSQLKYENDRLKLALAQSSANAKKWEVELQTLKNNNARLTTALQESSTNVEEWKKQLAAYKDENAVIKSKLTEMENSIEEGAEVKAVVQAKNELELQKTQLEVENREKDQTIMEISRRLEEVLGLETENSDLKAQLQAKEERTALLDKINQDLSQQIRNVKEEEALRRQKMAAIQSGVGNHLKEMSQLHQEMETVFNN